MAFLKELLRTIKLILISIKIKIIGIVKMYLGFNS
jgi:hypothetical protein